MKRFYCKISKRHAGPDDKKWVQNPESQKVV